MKYQATPGSCAAAALQAALRALGSRVGQGRLRELVGVTASGADEHDLLQAIDSLGLRPDELNTNRKAEARAWLLERAPVHPVILCVDNWEHWVTVAGQCGDRMFLFDSTREPWNTCERGTWPLKVETILKRWKAARKNRTHGGMYYAIGVLFEGAR